MDELLIIKENSNIIEKNKELGSGGEGKIFSLKSKKYKDFVYKEFYNTTNEQEKKIEYLIKIKSKIKNPNIIWPKYIVLNTEDKITGVIRKKLDNFLPIYSFYNINERLRYNIKYEDKKFYIINQIINIVKELHLIGVIIGDINYKNFVFDPNNYKVYLYDLENSGIENKFYTNNYAIEEFNSPEFLNKTITNKSFDQDIWSISILIFYIYFEGMFPFKSNKMNVSEQIIEGNFIFSDINFKNNFQKKQYEKYKKTKLKKYFDNVFILSHSNKEFRYNIKDIEKVIKKSFLCQKIKNLFSFKIFNLFKLILNIFTIFLIYICFNYLKTEHIQFISYNNYIKEKKNKLNYYYEKNIKELSEIKKMISYLKKRKKTEEEDIKRREFEKIRKTLLLEKEILKEKKKAEEFEKIRKTLLLEKEKRIKKEKIKKIDKQIEKIKENNNKIKIRVF